MNRRMEDNPVRRAVNAGERLLAGRFPVFAAGGGRLIAAAALLHVALAVGLFSVGRAQLAPQLLNRDAIMIVSDSYQYQSGAVRLAEILQNDGLRAWAAEPERMHVKLISIQFACLSPLFGYSALSAEPFNLFCYVAILSLVLMLGREVGGRRVGLLAAGIVALWPTFLLHTTQLLKDPLFIAAALALILVVTTWLTRTYSWTAAVGTSALMLLAAGLLLLIRVRFAVVIFAIVCFGFALLVVRQLMERRVLYWNLLCPVLILCAGALAPFYLTAGNQKHKQYPSDGSGQPKSVVTGKQVTGVVSYRSQVPLKPKLPADGAGRLHATMDRAALEIGGARYKFNFSWPESGSGIDRSVEYKDLRSLILYLPRAFAIGFWSPFPATWVGEGKSVGRAGRALSGAETLLIYLCQLLALVCILREPRCLPAWLLLLITLLGVIMLGLVVSNLGTLYRFRYLFWILLIILGVKGYENVMTRWRAGASNSCERSGELREAG